MKITKQIKDVSLTAKFNALSILLVLITAIAVTTYAVKREWDNQIKNLIEEGRQTAQLLAEFSDYAIYTGDSESIKAILNSRNDSVITYLGLLRQDTSVLADKWFEAESNVFPGWRKQSIVNGHNVMFSENEHYIQFIAPVLTARNSGLDAFVADSDTALETVMDADIRDTDIEDAGSRDAATNSTDSNETNVKDEKVGYVRLIFNTAEMNQQATDAVFASILMTVLIVFVAIALTLLLARRITRPVNQLLAATQEISSGRLDDYIE
ncbi:MAG: HAMP domain-containing protein, partial [Gammaproteobacteria bacterium]